MASPFIHRIVPAHPCGATTTHRACPQVANSRGMSSSCGPNGGAQGREGVRWGRYWSPSKSFTCSKSSLSLANHYFKRWNRELTLKCKLKCYMKPMKDPLRVSPSKGNQGTTRGKEKIHLTSVGIEPTTSELDLPLLCRLSYEVRQRESGRFRWWIAEKALFKSPRQPFGETEEVTEKRETDFNAGQIEPLISTDTAVV